MECSILKQPFIDYNLLIKKIKQNFLAEPPAYSISIISSTRLDTSVYTDSTNSPINGYIPERILEICETESQQRPCSSTNSQKLLCSTTTNKVNNNDEAKETPLIRRPVRFMTASLSTFVSKSGGSQRRKSLKSDLTDSKIQNRIKNTIKRPLTTAVVLDSRINLE